jgi:stage II sporulation protein D
MSNLRKLLIALGACAALFSALAPVAGADWVIKGRGFGHGVGMSQYGAQGFAQHGRSYKQILHHYYLDTKLGVAKTKKVRVLVGSGNSSVGFRGAKKACGHSTKPRGDYSFDLRNGQVKLRRGSGVIANCGRQATAGGGKAVSIAGDRYHGALIVRRDNGALLSINKVSIDDYVKGVVPNEMPAAWEPAALKTQAVAARSFALATTVNGDGFDLYDDTRSQVYGGLDSERRSSNRAVAATSRQVLRYHGKVIVAYFSSTSGGRTESVQFGFPGASPVPYLKSAKDPFDDISPYHRWKLKRSDHTVASRLRGLFKGKLRRIKILETGVSPRIVRARIVGSRGSSVVSGPTLQGRLQLLSTWASFKRR